MAELRWNLVAEKPPRDNRLVMIAILFNKEQAITINFGCLENEGWRVPEDRWLQADIDAGYTTVIAWCDLDDLYSSLDEALLYGTRDLQTL